jgi:hypothetical protein
MSGLRSLFGTASVNYTGLQVQTAVNTLPVPLVWGQARLAPNVLWYNNFNTSGGSKGGGKGGGSGSVGSKLFGDNQQATYTADIILGLCEGPISSINVVWKNQSIYSLGELGLGLFTGTTPQGTWGYLAASDPSEALAYQGTCYLVGEAYQLNAAATLDAHNFEVQGFRYGTGYGQTSYATYVNEVYNSVVIGNATNSTNSPLPWNGNTPATGYFDADPALIVSDFLTNAQYGVGFPSPSIDSSALFTSSGTDSSYQTYCRAIGIALSPALVDQEQASSILQRFLQLTNTAAVWSGGLLRLIPYGDQAVSGNGVTYTPNVTPVYDLDDDDFQIKEGGKGGRTSESPLQVMRKDPWEAYNIYRLECADRANQYMLTTVEARDQSAIELVAQMTGTGGERIASTVTAHEICDAGVGSIVAQLILQRGLYIRNTYKFTLPWEYCLLDPMDLVTITDTLLGLNGAAVRITEIQEDDRGLLEITAEEFPQGVATATKYPTQSSSSAIINRNASPGPVNTPLIFEPPAALVSAPQIWVAASGGSSGAVNTNWGGCNVWVSLDGSSYTQIGTIVGASPQGSLTAGLNAYSGTNPDTTDVLSVNLAESAGTLQSATLSEAELGNTLCIVDNELLSFETATLTSGNAYNLTSLFRGLYGTTAAAHLNGAPFCRLDNYVTFALPSQYVGQTIYVKLQSFNIFGGGLQDLSSCTAYTFTPTGGADDHPVARAMQATTVLDFGAVTTSPGVTDDFGTPALAVEIDDDLGSA